jgi:hypothetical protein
VLQVTGNTSTKSWFIVLNSLVAEAYKVTCTSQSAYRPSKRRNCASSNGREYIKLHPTLLNSIQLCIIILPPNLRYHNQYLDFGTRTFDGTKISPILHLHSSIYSIALMHEVARLVALRPYVFEAYAQKLVKMTGEVGRVPILQKEMHLATSQEGRLVNVLTQLPRY